MFYLVKAVLGKWKREGGRSCYNRALSSATVGGGRRLTVGTEPPRNCRGRVEVALPLPPVHPLEVGAAGPGSGRRLLARKDGCPAVELYWVGLRKLPQ